MTLFIEISSPLQLRPGIFRSESMLRAWWGFVAIGVLRVPFRRFCETPYNWSSR